MPDTPWTKGPWTIVRYGDGDSLVVHAADSEWRICFMATPGSSPGAMERIEADAHAIAAMPELAAALQYARNLIGPDEIIDAALSKARGGTHA